VKKQEVKSGKAAESGRKVAAETKEKENWHLPYMDKKAKGIVAVDGCPMHCALRTLNKADFQVDRHLTPWPSGPAQGP